MVVVVSKGRQRPLFLFLIVGLRGLIPIFSRYLNQALYALIATNFVLIMEDDERACLRTMGQDEGLLLA